MTQEQMIELARRAVACKGWRWMPGMRWWTEDDRGRLDNFQPEYMGRPPGALPDLTDPATLGCLLALVRAAYGDGMIGPERDYWALEVRFYWYYGPSEPDVLVQALEAAPQ